MEIQWHHTKYPFSSAGSSKGFDIRVAAPTVTEAQYLVAKAKFDALSEEEQKELRLNATAELLTAMRKALGD